MPSESHDHPLRIAIELLQRHRVEFIVIGGQAESIMGGTRVTFDSDFCYRRTPENAERLAAALKEVGARLRGAPPDLPFRLDARTLLAGLNFTFTTSIGDLDFLGEVEPVGAFDSVIERAEWYEVWGLKFPTISLDDLLRVKLHIKRAKDIESISQLTDIKRSREEQHREGDAPQ